MTDTTMKAAQPADRSTAIKIGLVVFFIAIAAVTGYFSYRFVRGLVGSWTLTDLPGFQVSAVQTTATPGGPDATAPAEAPAVAAVPAAATPEPWEDFPTIVRLIDRGKLQDKTSDLGAMELFAQSVVASDPFQVAAGLIKAKEARP